MKPLPAIAIIAGGLAKRLHPITKMIPKSMIDVAGEPFVAHQLRLLARQGGSKVVMLLGHLGEQIEAYVGDGSDFGLDVTYSYDGKCLIGTGGAVLQAMQQLGDPFLVTYGDSYLDVDFAEIFEAFEYSKKPALLTVYRNDNNFNTSNVVFEQPNVVKYTKTEQLPDMNYIDYGILVLTKSVFADRKPGDAFDLAEIIEKLADQGKLTGHEVFQRYFEIGSHEGLQMTEKYLYSKGY